ncbi:hypothetical protein ATANTOWER_001374 [Ataeniobius toweri]|uniref:Uncharacterized protein n=1 Tax=Ataeniobius toweri TaxID=208326 RepID=A0ABU7C815_9TELE|nr:hypothetical protein [Ataeniobius toweri]
MEASSQSISQQVVWKDVEAEKQKKTRSHNYHWVALVLAVVFLVLAVCVFSLRYLWAPSLGKIFPKRPKELIYPSWMDNTSIFSHPGIRCCVYPELGWKEK